MGGINIRTSGEALLIEAALTDGDGELVTTGDTDLYLYEAQSDGTLKSYDFDDDTFKTGALTTETLSLTHRQGDNGGTDTGIWTAVLSTVTGFTAGSICYAMIHNANASPPWRHQKFQYGGAEGDVEADQLDQAIAFLVNARVQKQGDAADLTIKAADGITNLVTFYPRTSVTVTGANWTNATKRLTETGAFARYVHRTGDTIELTAGTGVTTGEYTISAKIDDDTIELATDINGDNGDITDDSVEGVVENDTVMMTVA